jgi:hypothetical protein
VRVVGRDVGIAGSGQAVAALLEIRDGMQVSFRHQRCEAEAEVAAMVHSGNVRLVAGRRIQG